MSAVLLTRPRVLYRYLAVSLVLHLLWEMAQLPLYTIWTDEPLRRQVFAVVHCTLGDVMIAGLAILIALGVAGTSDWPRHGWWAVWGTAIALGLGYTVFSEWLNVNIRGSWAYAPSMPILPLSGTGLSPVMQWLFVPSLALHVAGWRRS